MSKKKAFEIINSIKRSTAALCLIAIAANSLTTFTFAEEETNSLPADVTDLPDMKDAYWDITVRHFSNGDITDVIQQTVPGWEIAQEEPTPDEMNKSWNKEIQTDTVPQIGIGYRQDYRYRKDENLGFEILEKSILECYKDGDLLWDAEFTDFSIKGNLYTANGTTVWGTNETWSSSQPRYGWIALINDEGNMLWEHRPDHGFSNEYIAAVLDNGDGTFAVISRGDLKYLCLSCYDTDGNEIIFNKTKIGNLGIWDAARLGDGYIIHTGNMMSYYTATLFRLDHEGNILDNYAYEGENCVYYLTDMAEYRGQLYLSAYAIPKQYDEGGRHEIANILDYVFSDDGFTLDISSEELTPLVRNNYTAILLVCDADSGAPKTIYSVNGSLGGKISVNGTEQLEWEVESITSTFFSPLTSSFTIGGRCKVFRYSFNSEGNLTRQSDTGESIVFRK